MYFTAQINMIFSTPSSVCCCVLPSYSGPSLIMASTSAAKHEAHSHMQVSVSLCSVGCVKCLLLVKTFIWLPLLLKPDVSSSNFPWCEHAFFNMYLCLALIFPISTQQWSTVQHMQVSKCNNFAERCKS